MSKSRFDYIEEKIELLTSQSKQSIQNLKEEISEVKESVKSISDKIDKFLDSQQKIIIVQTEQNIKINDLEKKTEKSESKKWAIISGGLSTIVTLIITAGFSVLSGLVKTGKPTP